MILAILPQATKLPDFPGQWTEALSNQSSIFSLIIFSLDNFLLEHQQSTVGNYASN